VGIKFCEHVPKSLRNKALNRLILNLFEKVVFLASKILQSCLGTWKETFSSTLNVTISQMVRNECLRFGVHVDI
jgi:uroporphyrinogen-III synthase